VETEKSVRRRNLSKCVFCDIDSKRIVQQTDLLVAIRDLFPVTALHTLIIPKRHVASYFELTNEELDQVHNLLKAQRQKILSADAAVSGFNIGINDGDDAGQTIFHCHIHLIPRRKGDVEDARGGVRGIIPEKQVY
jgi:ATP adenylyltransferase